VGVGSGSDGWGARALGRRRWSPEFGSRGGTTPAMADLGRPAFIRDDVKPGRMPAARAMHLGDQCGGLGLGSVIPTARRLGVTVAGGCARAEGEEGQERRGVLLTTPGCCDDSWRPGIEGAGVVSWWRRSSVDGGGSNPRAVQQRKAKGKKVGEIDAAEGERERAAAKKGGVGSLGVRVNRAAASHGPLGPVLIRTRRPSRRVWARGPGQRVARLGMAQRRWPKGVAARATASGQEDGPAEEKQRRPRGGRNARPVGPAWQRKKGGRAAVGGCSREGGAGLGWAAGEKREREREREREALGWGKGGSGRGPREGREERGERAGPRVAHAGERGKRARGGKGREGSGPG
jgi:hypothetical protein